MMTFRDMGQFSVRLHAAVASNGHKAVSSVFPLRVSLVRGNGLFADPGVHYSCCRGLNNFQYYPIRFLLTSATQYTAKPQSY